MRTRSPGSKVRRRIGHDGRAERAAVVVDLRLGQVERVLALDGAVSSEDEPELRLGHVPARVGTHGDGLSGSPHAPAGSLEEELGSLGAVEVVVERWLGRRLDPGVASSLVRDSRAPHLLALDGRQPRRVARTGFASSPLEGRGEPVLPLRQQVVEDASGRQQVLWPRLDRAARPGDTRGEPDPEEGVRHVHILRGVTSDGTARDGASTLCCCALPSGA
jgi:hypothetical protein